MRPVKPPPLRPANRPVSNPHYHQGSPTNSQSRRHTKVPNYDRDPFGLNKSVPATMMKPDQERLLEEGISMKMEINTYKGENLKLKTRINQLEREISKRDEELDDLRSKAGEKHYYAALQKATLVSSLKQTIKDLKSDLQQKDEGLSTLKKSLKYTQISEMEMEIEAYATECSRLKAFVVESAAKTSHIREPPSGIDQAQGQIISKLNKEKLALEKSLQSLQEKVTRLEMRLKSSESQCDSDDLKLQMTKAREDLTFKDRNLAQAQDRIRQLNSVVKELEEELKTVRGENEELKDRGEDWLRQLKASEEREVQTALRFLVNKFGSKEKSFVEVMREWEGDEMGFGEMERRVKEEWRVELPGMYWQAITKYYMSELGGVDFSRLLPDAQPLEANLRAAAAEYSEALQSKSKVSPPSLSSQHPSGLESNQPFSTGNIRTPSRNRYQADSDSSEHSHVPTSSKPQATSDDDYEESFEPDSPTTDRRKGKPGSMSKKPNLEVEVVEFEESQRDVMVSEEAEGQPLTLAPIDQAIYTKPDAVSSDSLSQRDKSSSLPPTDRDPPITPPKSSQSPAIPSSPSHLSPSSASARNDTHLAAVANTGLEVSVEASPQEEEKAFLFPEDSSSVHSSRSHGDKGESSSEGFHPQGLTDPQPTPPDADSFDPLSSLPSVPLEPIPPFHVLYDSRDIDPVLDAPTIFSRTSIIPAIAGGDVDQSPKQTTFPVEINAPEAYFAASKESDTAVLLKSQSKEISEQAKDVYALQPAVVSVPGESPEDGGGSQPRDDEEQTKMETIAIAACEESKDEPVELGPVLPAPIELTPAVDTAPTQSEAVLNMYEAVSSDPVIPTTEVRPVADSPSSDEDSIETFQPVDLPSEPQIEETVAPSASEPQPIVSETFPQLPAPPAETMDLPGEFEPEIAVPASDPEPSSPIVADTTPPEETKAQPKAELSPNEDTKPAVFTFTESPAKSKTASPEKYAEPLPEPVRSKKPFGEPLPPLVFGKKGPELPKEPDPTLSLKAPGSVGHPQSPTSPIPSSRGLLVAPDIDPANDLPPASLSPVHDSSDSDLFSDGGRAYDLHPITDLLKTNIAGSGMKAEEIQAWIEAATTDKDPEEAVKDLAACLMEDPFALREEDAEKVADSLWTQARGQAWMVPDLLGEIIGGWERLGEEGEGGEGEGEGGEEEEDDTPGAVSESETLEAKTRENIQLIATSLLASNQSVRLAFESESGLISTAEFLSGLRRLGLVDLPSDELEVLQLSLSATENGEICVEEMEKLFKMYGVLIARGEDCEDEGQLSQRNEIEERKEELLPAAISSSHPPSDTPKAPIILPPSSGLPSDPSAGLLSPMSGSVRLVTNPLSGSGSVVEHIADLGPRSPVNEIQADEVITDTAGVEDSGGTEYEYMGERDGGKPSPGK